MTPLEIKSIVLNLLGLNHLTDNVLYQTPGLNLEVQTPAGYTSIVGFIQKKDEVVFIELDDERSVSVGSGHMFIDINNNTIKASSLHVGDKIKTNTGMEGIKSITNLGIRELYDISIDTIDHVFYDAAGILHHNTFSLEKELEAAGLKDGEGYYKNVGAGSAAAIYEVLYKHRTEIIFFDEADTIMNDPEVRNMIKAATDSGKTRKVSYNKKGANYYDPAFEQEPEEDDERLPRYFNFTGGVIIVANVPINKLDPDKAIRTRGFVMDMQPTREEVLEFIEDIVLTMQLPAGLFLAPKDRVDVFAFVKQHGGKTQVINIRTVLNAMKIAAAFEGDSGWEDMLQYSA